MLVGPSGSGKTVLLTNTILDIYKGCFSRIYFWSPSIEVDNTWKPVKDYIRDHTKPNDRGKHYFDSYGPAELEQVINTQKSYRLPERKKHKYLYHILTVIGDFADDKFYTKVSIITSVIHKRKTLHDFNNYINTGL